MRDPQGTFAAWAATHPTVAQVADSSREGELTRATVELHHDDRERLAADLIAAGYGLRGFEAEAHALEAVFLGLTKHREA